VLLLLLGCAETSLSRPNAAVLADGLIHVSDFHNQRIVTFDEDGRFVSTIGRKGLSGDGLWEVWGLLADGADLHVLNTRPISHDNDDSIVEVKTFRDGRLVSIKQLIPEASSDLDWSDGFVKTAQGWMVASLSDDALLAFSADGALSHQITTPGSGQALHAPTGIHGEEDGIWVIEQFDNRIRHLAVDGTQRLVFGIEGAEPGELRFPKALDVCTAGGWMAVADLGNYRLQRFDLAGAFLDGFEPPPRDDDSPVQLMDVELSADCTSMALVDSKGDRVLLAEPDGTIFNSLDRW